MTNSGQVLRWFGCIGTPAGGQKGNNMMRLLIAFALAVFVGQATYATNAPPGPPGGPPGAPGSPSGDPGGSNDSGNGNNGGSDGGDGSNGGGPGDSDGKGGKDRGGRDRGDKDRGYGDRDHEGRGDRGDKSVDHGYGDGKDRGHHGHDRGHDGDSHHGKSPPENSNDNRYGCPYASHTWWCAREVARNPSVPQDPASVSATSLTDLDQPGPTPEQMEKILRQQMKFAEAADSKESPRREDAPVSVEAPVPAERPEVVVVERIVTLAPAACLDIWGNCPQEDN